MASLNLIKLSAIFVIGIVFGIFCGVFITAQKFSDRQLFTALEYDGRLILQSAENLERILSFDLAELKAMAVCELLSYEGQLDHHKNRILQVSTGSSEQKAALGKIESLQESINRHKPLVGMENC